jgi:ATP-dependent protease HslVU (ClpYQ) peptidase subunit
MLRKLEALLIVAGNEQFVYYFRQRMEKGRESSNRMTVCRHRLGGPYAMAAAAARW